MAQKAIDLRKHIAGSTNTVLATDMFDSGRVQMFDGRSGKSLGSVKEGLNGDLMVSLHLDDATGTIVIEATPAQQSLF